MLAVTCPRGWFPPATFQLRLRSLRALIYVASAEPRHGQNNGYFFVSLHETVDSEALWTSCRLKWCSDKEERLEWSDIDINAKHAHLGLKSIVIKIWFACHGIHQETKAILEASWGIYFSGLWCLGTHPPAHGRLPPNALILHMCGSYFSSASHIRDSSTGVNCIPRYLHIGSPEECQAVKSYDTTLLLRLHRSQRALKQQEVNNTRLIKDLHSRGIDHTDLTTTAACSLPLKSQPVTGIVNPGALPSRRQTFFAKRFKLPETRLAERDFSARAEVIRIRISLLQRERDRRQQVVDSIRMEHKSLQMQIEEKTSSQMECYHDLAKEKAAFNAWFEQFRVDILATDTWLSVLRQQRLSLVSALQFIFPIGDLGGKRPTLRWVTLPPSNEIKDSTKNETNVSVVMGWLAHLVFVISRIMDVSLRYPIRLMGSTSTIHDEIKVLPEERGHNNNGPGGNGEFPLYLKSTSANDWARFDYAIYLLNKDVSQLRWQCGMVTSDLRPTLQNLEEVIVLGVNSPPRGEVVAALPSITTRTSPPTSSVVHQIVIKNGRAIIPGAVRRCSLDAQTTKASSPGWETQFPMDDPVSSPTSTNETSSDASEAEQLGHHEPKEVVDPTIDTPEICDIKTVMKSSLDDPLTVVHDDGDEPAVSTVSSSNIFWNDVTSRTMALSTRPSSFQRPRANNH